MQKYHDEPKQYKGYLKSALTISVLSVMIAELLAFTAVSRATLSWRTISEAPSAVFGTAVAIPASTARAAVSASIVSFLPWLRRLRRSQWFTSTTRTACQRTKLASPTP